MLGQHRSALDGNDMRQRVRGYSPRPVAVYTRSVEGVLTQRIKSVNSAASKTNETFNESRFRKKPSAQTHAQNLGEALNPKNQVITGAVNRRHNNLRPSIDIVRNSKSALPSKPPRRSVTLQTVNQPEKIKPANSVHIKSKKSKRTYLTYSMALLAVMIGVGLWGLSLRNNREVVAQIQEFKSVQSSDSSDNGGIADSSARLTDYDETEPVPAAPYVVAPDLPKYVIIDKIGVKARVKRVGVDASNVMQTPRNIYDTGWFDGSSKPGEIGAMFINGHVSGPTKKGVFYKLKNLTEGDAITVERGDGVELHYKVVASESFPAHAVDMTKALRPYGDATEGLTLMTCGGAFDRESQSYAARQVVYAVRQ